MYSRINLSHVSSDLSGYMGGRWSRWAIIRGKLSYGVRCLWLEHYSAVLVMFGLILQELLALGEVVGTESRGLSADTIASLPSVNYKSQNTQEGSNDSWVNFLFCLTVIKCCMDNILPSCLRCVICRLDYEDGDTLTLLSCKHSYHPECINNWLRINKVHGCSVWNIFYFDLGSEYSFYWIGGLYLVLFRLLSNYLLGL